MFYRTMTLIVLFGVLIGHSSISALKSIEQKSTLSQIVQELTTLNEDNNTMKDSLPKQEDILHDIQSDKLCNTNSKVTVFDGKLYIFFNEGKPWNDANSHCNVFRGILAEPKTEAVNNHIKQLINDNPRSGYTWLGGYYAHRAWIWVSGGGIRGYTNWYYGRPQNGGCLCMTYVQRSDTQKWLNPACRYSFPYVCQVPLA